MPIRIEPPVKKEFVLEGSDAIFGVPKENCTKVTIRQATQEAHERLAALIERLSREWNRQTETVRLINEASSEEVKRMQVMLTLAASNIEGPDGESLFKFDDRGFIRDEVAFRKAWGGLPPQVAEEIHSKVLEVNVIWAKQGEVF